jgi:RNase adaptor protein for sRNA GlmZ degradation
VEEYLVSQRQAVKMLRDTGLSRRAAYYQVDNLPHRMLVDSKVYARVDVELLREKIAAGIEARAGGVAS